MKFVLAFDQGTTSSRAIVFDEAGSVCAMAQRETTQIYPQPGWVEHDADEIWASVTEVVPRALQNAGVEPKQIVGIGITNQRETVVFWERSSGKPLGHVREDLLTFETRG